MSAIIHIGDCLEVLKTLEDESVQTCITSPPYWGLRDYGVDGQLGLDETPDEFTQNLVSVFREVRRVLKVDGTTWINLGDSYSSNSDRASMKLGAHKKSCECTYCIMESSGLKTKVPKGLKAKDLVGIPWRVAFALQSDGWWLRQDIIWHKPNPMPESVTDRCTKAHEYIFLLSKSAKYYFNNDAVKEEARGSWSIGQKDRLQRVNATGGAITGGTGDKVSTSETRNKRSVWTVSTKPFSEAHFATFPPALIEPCVLAGSAEGDTVLDPFNGAGTTGLVALAKNRNYIGIELNPEYAQMALRRINNDNPMFNEVRIAA